MMMMMMMMMMMDVLRCKQGQKDLCNLPKGYKINEQGVVARKSMS